MVRSIVTIIKNPRSDPIPDKPTYFKHLENLHLELLENKAKIKPGLPIIPPVKKRNPPQPKSSSPKKRKKERKTEEPKTEEHKTEEHKTEKSKKTSEKPKLDENIGDYKDVLEELGDDEFDPIELELGDEDEGEEDEEDEGEIDEEDEDEGDEEEDEEDEKVKEEDDPYAGLTPEEREMKEKQEYIWRFNILKKQYKDNVIPAVNEHTDLPMMKSMYDRTVREVYLDDAVNSYRSYLMGGFVVMEFVCTQMLGFDMSGFTQQQTRMMSKYDMMLIELGEKSYNTWGANVPVELRLVGLVLFQTAIFYLGKVISSKYGGNVGDLFKGMTGQPGVIDNTTKSDDEEVAPNPKKKRMRGPKIRAEDIRNMSHQDK